MIEILRIADTLVNPEAMVRAAVAAANAENAAYWAAILAVLTLGAVLVLGAMVVYIAFQFRELVKETKRRDG